ncbi:dihydrofolate reductase, partial [Candidatus Parcubacteria bacterium]|nr:dihydrofolate reductase [Patescibacteria group bacterium]MCG2688222.1 dihydrofolate reductase [Candidatus Parcubacteria bacterium]
NRVIGMNNALPWRLPIDMKRFQQLTMGKPVIMGQKTLESMGKALPGRINIILTLDKNFKATDCLIAHSIEEALQIAKEKMAKETMIIGGASVYKQFLPLADRLYLTIIEKNFEGDVFFPKINYNEWEETERIENEPDKNNLYAFTFLTLERASHD